MPVEDSEFYYADGKKVKLNRIPDSFAIKYKENVSTRAMAVKLSDQPGLDDVEERKDLPKSRLVIVTLPQSRRLADVGPSLRSLESDKDVEFVVPVFREPKSGLRLVATDEITVRFKSGTTPEAIERINRENDAEIIEKNRFVQNQFILRLKDPKDVLAAANRYQSSDLTEFAEPNFVTETKKAAVPNDEYFHEQWHLHNTGQDGGLVGEDVRARDAWDITQGSPGIVIAAIDDGVDIEHPDLQANIWKNPNPADPDVNGWNFFSDNDNPRPQKFSPPYDDLDGNDSHGTPCAGVAAAVGNNGRGVSGMAPMCKILPVKIFMGNDMVPSNILADAIRYAGQKADVLSNSWGTSPSSNVSQAIKDVIRIGRGGKGCPVFVATGNTDPVGNDYISFPSSVPEAIAVGASNNQGVLSYYSDYGEGIDFVAPSNGGTKGIFTTDVAIRGRGFNIGNVNQGDAEGLYTNSFGGTSSATPLAAGVAALILSLNPDLTWDQVRRYMRDSADKIDAQRGNYANGYSLKYGFGRINAKRALEMVKADMQGGHEGNVIEKRAAPAVAIPDHDLNGIASSIIIDEDGTIQSFESISINITHTFQGDLRVSLITPDNTSIMLHDGTGGGADNLVETYDAARIPALQQLQGKSVRGQWTLKVIDRWASDTGRLNDWKIRIKTIGNMARGSSSPGFDIPDNDPKGVISTIAISQSLKVKDLNVSVDISHTFIQDLAVTLISPSGKKVFLHNHTGGSKDNIRQIYYPAAYPQMAVLLGDEPAGDWKLHVADTSGMDKGKLNKWEIELKG
jgi:subtilisin-like proprotein convertase family protein/subtilisin family serine protease